MYTLKLTLADRQAIDWVGYRYWHGDDFRALLEHDCTLEETDLKGTDVSLWDDCQEIIFHVPEHIAWEIREHLMENGLACFSSPLVHKLTMFLDSIV